MDEYQEQTPMEETSAPAEETETAEVTETAEQAQKKDSLLRRFWLEWRGVLLCLVIVFVLFKFILQLAWVPSGSMEPTLPTNSLTIGWQMSYVLGDPEPKRGQIVTFWNDELDELLIKRIIGLPGDTVTFSAGYVYINGELLDEQYLDGQGVTDCDKTFVVPEGCFFPMGDNRPGSFDARDWREPYMPIDQLQARTLVAISFGRDHAWQGIHWMTGR